jgi:hypothetical protein
MIESGSKDAAISYRPDPETLCTLSHKAPFGKPLTATRCRPRQPRAAVAMILQIMYASRQNKYFAQGTMHTAIEGLETPGHVCRAAAEYRYAQGLC